ncbi:MAG: DNA topoisomerase IV subunit B, partial [Alphaproteobacteria bacterium]|nr:DNA topoisomerase IV subunit B [Alphaproteobacteria bacterium]
RDDGERVRILESGLFKANQKVEVGRFKGLGEMNAKQLKETAMDPAHRTMLRIELGDGDRSEIGEAVNALMGSKPESRFRFIQERAAFAEQLDI